MQAHPPLSSSFQHPPPPPRTRLETLIFDMDANEIPLPPPSAPDRGPFAGAQISCCISTSPNVPAIRHRKEISDFPPLSYFPSICQMAAAVLFRRWQVRPQPPPHRTADGAAPPPLSLLFLSFSPSSPQLFVSPSHYSAPPPPPGTGGGYYTSRWRPGRGAPSPLLKGRASTPTPLAVQRVGR